MSPSLRYPAVIVEADGAWEPIVRLLDSWATRTADGRVVIVVRTEQKHELSDTVVSGSVRVYAGGHYVSLAGEPVGAERVNAHDSALAELLKALADGRLTSKDLAKLASEGISAEIAAAAGLYRVGPVQASNLLGFRPGNRNYQGIVFPYTSPFGTTDKLRIRRDYPDVQRQPDGSQKVGSKYMGPKGLGKRVLLCTRVHARADAGHGLARRRLRKVKREAGSHCMVRAWRRGSSVGHSGRLELEGARGIRHRRRRG